MPTGRDADLVETAADVWPFGEPGLAYGEEAVGKTRGKERGARLKLCHVLLSHDLLWRHQGVQGVVWFERGDGDAGEAWEWPGTTGEFRGRLELRPPRQ